MKKLLSFTVFMATSFAFSCSKEDPKPDCGCDGPTMLILKNTPAVHEGAGLFTFKDPTTLNKITAWACDPDSTWAKSENRESPDYTIAGNLKKACFFGPTVMIIYPSIDITAISKK